ncbi:unnamed protein product, partial [Anisakis simplex]|uniref:Rx_N domain-containing protein n=1 Tax=Anisakis simplex TaxID=6269 RepID=A0A0M3JDF7_ANISI
MNIFRGVTYSILFQTLLKQSPTKYERLMASIESVAFLEKRLKPLKAIRSWFLLADQLEDAIRSKNCNEICSSIHRIGSISCEGFDAEVEEKLLERREELWREANDSVGRLLADLLSEIGY